MFCGFGNLKYDERLEILNLFSLQYRKIRVDMIEIYKNISSQKGVNSSVLY